MTEPLAIVHYVVWSSHHDVSYACGEAGWVWGGEGGRGRGRVDEEGRSYADRLEDVTCLACHRAVARSAREAAEKEAAGREGRHAEAALRFECGVALRRLVGAESIDPAYAEGEVRSAEATAERAGDAGVVLGWAAGLVRQVRAVRGELAVARDEIGAAAEFRDRAWRASGGEGPTPEGDAVVARIERIGVKMAEKKWQYEVDSVTWPENVTAALNARGEEGWELVGVTAESMGRVLWFKKPKPSPARVRRRPPRADGGAR